MMKTTTIQRGRPVWSKIVGVPILVTVLALAPSTALAQGGGGLSPEQQAKILEIKIKALDIELKAQQLKSGTGASKVTKAADDIAQRARRIYDIGERILG